METKVKCEFKKFRLLLCPQISGAEISQFRYVPEFSGAVFPSLRYAHEFRGPECRSSAMPPNFRNSLVVLCYRNLIIPHFYIIYSVCSICHRSETHA